MALQAWYFYADLARMWHCSPRSIRKWLAALRQRAPDEVLCTFKLRNGYRRELLIAASTAVALQNRHVAPPEVLRALDASAHAARARARAARRPAQLGDARGRRPAVARLPLVRLPP